MGQWLQQFGQAALLMSQGTKGTDAWTSGQAGAAQSAGKRVSGMIGWRPRLVLPSPCTRSGGTLDLRRWTANRHKSCQRRTIGPICWLPLLLPDHEPEDQEPDHEDACEGAADQPEYRGPDGGDARISTVRLETQYRGWPIRQYPQDPADGRLAAGQRGSRRSLSPDSAPRPGPMTAAHWHGDLEFLR